MAAMAKYVNHDYMVRQNEAVRLDIIFGNELVTRARSCS